MKTTVYEQDFVDKFKDFGREDNFSRQGLRALFEYLEQLEEHISEELELDVIALCVEYAEYETALEAYNEQHGEDDFVRVDSGNTEENANAQALEWLQDNTIVIELDNGGVIIQNF